MINSKKLLSALQVQVTTLEDDLRARCEGSAAVDAPLRAQFDDAKKGQRIATTYTAWRDEQLTQVAVAWVLACVFVRFLEDNELVDPPRIAGPGPRLLRARDEHELYFREHPTFTEREYLESVFTEVGKLPGMVEFFDRRHNPLWLVGPSGDAAAALVIFWKKTDQNTGQLAHDFTDSDLNTRFLGDLYQELSEAAQKRYALLQTPDFIEAFILDRTLTPAIDTFGFQIVRLIDPTCGSGHFLLGGFARLFRLWQQDRPGENSRVLAQKALDSVFGVDLNPYAVAIARFRLLLAALKVCGIVRLKDAPAFAIHLAIGDSLLHGKRFRDFDLNTGAQRTFDTDELYRDELKHHYEVEDAEALRRILGQQYHAVVGNPPYINVKDGAVSELYRARFPSCHRQYSLSVPFMERFFDLALKGDGTPQQPAGFVGQITGNSFMKREFGKKLIEHFLPRWDLTHVIDTDKAHIPGHGTGTVILLGKNQAPVSLTIRVVMGIKKQIPRPEIPELGFAWLAIVAQTDSANSQTDWASTADFPRGNFHRHPWSIGGGGAAELKLQIEASAQSVLGKYATAMGFFGMTHADEVMLAANSDFRRWNVESKAFYPLIAGELIRDWQIIEPESVVFPYDEQKGLCQILDFPKLHRFLWPSRTSLGNRATFGKNTYFGEGRAWWAWHQISLERLTSRLSITFGFVATHNHFVLEKGDKVFKQSAPIIKLIPQLTEDRHVQLLGVLNSSTACFWLKQVIHDKGGGGIGGGISAEMWEHRFEFDSTKLAQCPLPPTEPSQLPTALVKISTALQSQSPAAVLANWADAEPEDPHRCLTSAREVAACDRRQLIAGQEELDWQIYEAFGLLEGAARSGPATVSLPEGTAVNTIPPDGIELGERAFEIVLARRMAAGDVQTTWFKRHGSTPITEVPRHWPAPYRELVERRIRRIESDANICLIEQPEYKRRWNTEPWDEQFAKAARDWLLARLEGYFHEGQRVCELKDGFDPASRGFTAATRPHLVTTNQLADIVLNDRTFLVVAELYQDRTGFSVPKLVRELVESESVPNLAVHRYKETGLRKRRDWESTWNLQRKEDDIESDVRKKHPNEIEVQLKKLVRHAQQKQVGDIPVPPKYAGTDFKKSTFWKLRGKLDVPKERWITYVGAERDGDSSPLIAWAGWDHLQQAQALAEYYLDAKTSQGWPTQKLKLLLAGLLDLLPWLKQWHNMMDPDYGMGLGDYFAGFLDEQVRGLSTTLEELERIRLGTVITQTA